MRGIFPGPAHELLQPLTKMHAKKAFLLPPRIHIKVICTAQFEVNKVDAQEDYTLGFLKTIMWNNKKRTKRWRVIILVEILERKETAQQGSNIGGVTSQLKFVNSKRLLNFLCILMVKILLVRLHKLCQINHFRTEINYIVTCCSNDENSSCPYIHNSFTVVSLCKYFELETWGENWFQIVFSIIYGPLLSVSKFVQFFLIRTILYIQYITYFLQRTEPYLYKWETYEQKLGQNFSAKSLYFSAQRYNL